MKALLIGGSLLCNAALAAALVMRPSLAPPTLRDFINEHRLGSAAPTPEKPKPARAKPAPKLWTQLDTTDLKSLAKRLTDAGFPPNIVRSIVSSIINERYTAQIRALIEPDPNLPFWKQRGLTGFGDKRYSELMRLQRERSQVLRDILGDPALAEADVSSGARRRFGNLPAAKIDMIRRIEEDYAEMMTSIRASMNGIELPEDREKFALLQKEKRADLAAALTPEEMADYEMRSSNLTNVLRSRFGAFDATEAEYRAIFQAYQSIGEKYGVTGMRSDLDMAKRNEALRTLAAQLQTGLGDLRYNQLLAASSPDYQQLARLTERQNLPSDTVSRALAVRDAAVQQSQQIVNDSSLTPEQKRAALEALGQNSRAQLTAMLPADAAQTYLKRANWLTMLNRGMGVSITPTPPLIIVNDSGATTSYSGGTQIRPLPVKKGGG